MNMVIPNEGKVRWIEWAVRQADAPVANFLVLLFKNDYTPVDASTLSDFIESDFTGYDRVTIVRADFSLPVLVGNVAEITYPDPPVFACTAGAAQDAYGWLMIDPDNDIAIAAQRFNTVRAMVPGSVETLDPFKIKLPFCA